MHNLPKFVLIEPLVKESNIEWFMGNIQRPKTAKSVNSVPKKEKIVILNNDNKESLTP